MSEKNKRLASNAAVVQKAAIVRRIALLEEEFGERLLVRGSRHLAITHFGERILDHARRLAELTDAASVIPLLRRTIACCTATLL